MKILITLFVILLLIPSLLSAQEILGQIKIEPIHEREATSFSIDNDNATVIISTPIQNLIVETSRRNIIRSKKEEGRRIIILPAGTERLTFRAKGYEPVEMEPYNFGKKKVYDIKIIEVRAPRGVISIVGKGSVTINTDPEGATITLDGLPGEWKSPAVIKNIIATNYTITAAKQKYDSASITVTVIHDSIVTIPTIKLAPQFGFLKITSDEAALLAINNKLAEYARDSIMELPLGKYLITLGKRRYQTFSKDVVILSGDTMTIQHTLVPTFAYFDFSPLPVNTKILLDDTPSQRVLVETTPGEHIISIENNRVGKLRKRFIIAPGATRMIKEMDIQDPGDLLVESDAIAQLFIDDSVALLSVVKNNIPAGLHTIRLVHKDLGEEVRTVQIIPNKRKDVFITMLPSRSSAVLLSVLPGASQMYNGMVTKGLLYLSSFAVSVAGSYYFYNEYDRKNKKYNGFVEEYKTTTSSLRAAELNNLITASYPKLITTKDQRQLAFGITGGIFLWSIIDTFIFPPKYGYRKQEDTAYDLRVDSDSKHITMGINVTF